MDAPREPPPPYIVDCTPPFSFYFDLVSHYWRYRPSVYASFYRVCAIARELQADTLIVEDAAHHPKVRREVAALRRSNRISGLPQARAISFFRRRANAPSVPSTPSTHALKRFMVYAREHAGFLGQVIVINCPLKGSPSNGMSYIFEAIMPPPPSLMVPDSNLLLRSFSVTVQQQKFSVRASYYCQQSSIIGNCGHAVVRTLCNHFGRDVETAKISRIIQDQPYNPKARMALDDIEAAIKHQAASAFPHDLRARSPSKTYLPLEREDLLMSLVSVLESGHA